MVSPARLIITNIGISTTWPGIIMVARYPWNSASLPGTGFFSNPYAAMAEATSTSRQEPTTVMMLFFRAVPKSRFTMAYQ